MASFSCQTEPFPENFVIGIDKFEQMWYTFHQKGCDIMEMQTLALLLGDDFPIIPLILIAVAAAAVLIVTSVLGKKDKDK